MACYHARDGCVGIQWFEWAEGATAVPYCDLVYENQGGEPLTLLQRQPTDRDPKRGGPTAFFLGNCEEVKRFKRKSAEGLSAQEWSLYITNDPLHMPQYPPLTGSKASEPITIWIVNATTPMSWSRKIARDWKGI